MDLVDEEGSDALTMRRLAQRLCVEAPSLYNHVANKQALIDGVVEQVLDLAARADDPSVPWLDRLRTNRMDYRAAVHAHPRAFPLLLQISAENSGLWRNAERMILAMEDAGLSPAQTRKWWLLLSGFTNGFLATELLSVGSHPAVSDAVRRDRPRMASFFDRMSDDPRDAHFASGLDALLQQLALEAPSSPRTRRES